MRNLGVRLTELLPPHTLTRFSYALKTTYTTALGLSISHGWGWTHWSFLNYLFPMLSVLSAVHYFGVALQNVQKVRLSFLVV
jgi:hypothetical protein